MSRHAWFFAALVLVAAAAHADGIVSMSWDGCVGPVARTVGPGEKAALYVSVISHTAPIKAHGIDVLVGQFCSDNPPGGLSTLFLPDAWRFELGGCQSFGGTQQFLTIDAAPPPELQATCPAFQPGPGVSVKEFTYDPISKLGRLRCWLAYNPVGSPNPAVRYHLARFVFDEARGTTGSTVPGACGGLEKAICFSLNYASWLALDGVEHPWSLGNTCVTANDPANTMLCAGATPVQTSTWGAVKGQYR